MDKPQYPSQFPQHSGPSPGPAPQQVPNPYGQAPGGSYPPPQNSGGDNPLGMIAMICGLLSLVMGCPLSIAAIILGFLGMKKEPKGMATAGLVLGIVTATLQLVMLCFVMAFYGLIFGAIAAGTAGMAAMKPYLDTATAFQQAAASIEAHHEATGAYPDEAEGTSLVQGTLDGWNHPIVYRLDGEEYVLVSPGPDGILDNEDDEDFYASQYVPPGSYGEADPNSPTQQAMALASEAIDESWYESDSDLYPADGEGQSLVAGFSDEWGRPIVYRQVDGGDGYLVISPGPDGALDTPDDLTYNGYEWTGEIPKPPTADPATSDDSRIWSATEREILKACQIVQEYYDSSDDPEYPDDAEGQAVIDHLTDEWGNTLVYRQTEDGDWGEVLSKGPDGTLGTSDDLNSATFYDP